VQSKDISDASDIVRRALNNLPDHVGLGDAVIALDLIVREATRDRGAGIFVPRGDGTSRCRACGFSICGETHRVKVTLPKL
jgi:hypothetical protein